MDIAQGLEINIQVPVSILIACCVCYLGLSLGKYKIRGPVDIVYIQFVLIADISCFLT